MELELHEFQRSILSELLFKPNARFSEIKKVDVENYHFNFHLTKLVEEGLVIKINGRYNLSESGKEFANRLDTDKNVMEKQAKLAVALHAVRKVNGKVEYLLHQRLKEPFFGWWGPQSGKIRWEETPIEAAKREFLEETGLVGDFKLKAIVHYHDYHKNGRFLEDKYFWVYKIENTQGTLIEKIEGGENKWLSEKEVLKIKNIFASLKEIREVLYNKKLAYIERKRVVNTY